MTHEERLRQANASACRYKRTWPTEALARAQATVLTARLREANPAACVHEYRCLRCGLWHVGTAPGAPHVDAVHQRNMRSHGKRAWRREMRRIHGK